MEARQLWHPNNASDINNGSEIHDVLFRKPDQSFFSKIFPSKRRNKSKLHLRELYQVKIWQLVVWDHLSSLISAHLFDGTC